MQLPVPIWFPLDLNDTWHFTFAYIFQILSLSVYAPSNVLIHTFYIGMISLTCAQLRVLGTILKSIDERNVSHILNYCIDMHREILK